jgi:hypothetical protein
MIYLGDKGEELPAKEVYDKESAVLKSGAPDGEGCTEKRSTQKVMQECRTEKNRAKARLPSAIGDWGAPMLVEKQQNQGGGGQDCRIT